MGVEDIPFHPARQTDEASPLSRVTLHHFAPSRLGPILTRFSPNNSDARQPRDTSEWPPAIILDLCYASAALRAWGPQAFISYAWNRAHNAYYDDTKGDGPGQAGNPDVLTGDQPTGPRLVGRSIHHMCHQMKDTLETSWILSYRWGSIQQRLDKSKNQLVHQISLAMKMSRCGYNQWRN